MQQHPVSQRIVVCELQIHLHVSSVKHVKEFSHAPEAEHLFLDNHISSIVKSCFAFIFFVLQAYLKHICNIMNVVADLCDCMLLSK